MSLTRRRLLQTVSSAAALGLVDWSPLRSLVAEDQPALAADGIRYSSEIEPLVRLIEETPREKCPEVLAENLKSGLAYRRFLSAIFLAAIRKQNSHHSVYLVHSAHQTSLDLPREESLLPLFWAVDHFKWQQLAAPTPPLGSLAGALPAADKAGADLHEAMKRLDIDRAERAIVALARTEGPQQTMELLWRYGCRDCGMIGHRAISLASCWRVLESIGWQHAEPVLRFVVRDLMGEDRYYKINVARAEAQWKKLPFAWATGNGDTGATRELFALMRQGKSEEASDLAGKQLVAGVGGQAIWDAVHVISAEMLILHPGESGMGGRALHINTAANALRYAFRTTASSQTRLLILLQAVAWMGDFVREQLGVNNLAETKPIDLAGTTATGSALEVIADVFSSLPPHAYIYDYKTRQGVGHHLPNKAARAEPARKIFALLTDNPDAAAPYAQAARSWLCMKASVDAHEYKLPVALFEDYEIVSSAWSPRLLAASTHWLHGKQSEDSLVIQQARDALGIKR